MTERPAPELPPFQRLVDEHGPIVWRFLRARVGHQDAADRYQETMLAALHAYPDLRHSTNLRGWLLTIARNEVVDGWRARETAAIPVAQPPEVPTHPSVPPDPSLWDAVRALPVGQRDAIALRYGADLAHREIAALLGCSEAASRQRVRAGLRRLRERITPDDAHPTDDAHATEEASRDA